MGYGDRDELPVSNEPTASVILISLVRGLGLMLLLAGLVTAAFILMEAWALYKYPERIEVLALAVEKGSNIDKALLPKKLSGENGSRAGQDGDSASVSSESTNVRLSYFYCPAQRRELVEPDPALSSAPVRIERAPYRQPGGSTGCTGPHDRHSRSSTAPSDGLRAGY